MDVIFVAGAWGSGTTAVTGALHKLGVPVFGPLLELNDARTPNSYELEPFVEVFRDHWQESALKLRNPDGQAAFARDMKAFAAQLAHGDFGPWPEGPRRVVLKYPLASMALPVLAQTFERVRVVVVTRPRGDIERTRQRRQWAAHLGARGAVMIYAQLMSDLMETRLPFIGTSHAAVLEDPDAELARIARFCELEDLMGNLPEAARFIRRE